MEVFVKGKAEQYALHNLLYITWTAMCRIDEVESRGNIMSTSLKRWLLNSFHTPKVAHDCSAVLGDRVMCGF